MTTSDGLPEEVLRPLRRAAVVVCVFLAGFVVWATSSELATTIRVPGTVSSIAPSFEVQVSRNARVLEVAVRRHDWVATGDLLFRMDTTEAELDRDSLQLRAELLRAEISEAEGRLFGLPDQPIINISVTDAFREADTSHQADLDSVALKLSTTADRRTGVESQLALRLDQHRLALTRLSRLRTLVETGSVPIAELEAAETAVLEIEAQVASYEAELEMLETQASVAEQELTQIEAAFRARLAERASRARGELEQVLVEIAQLDLQIAEGEVRSPIDGHVTDLAIDAPGMMAGAGRTMAIISPPVDRARLTLHVPVRHIDQVVVGQSGLVTISPLPQRTAPRVSVTIAALSDQPVTDEAGTPMYYLAEAVFSEESVALFGPDGTLIHGMPVSISLDGEPTTLGAFLASPVTAVWSRAFEE